MGIFTLISMYGLSCLSILVSITISGFAIGPTFKFFEKNSSTEAARQKSLLVALILWMLLQLSGCLLVFVLYKRYLV